MTTDDEFNLKINTAYYIQYLNWNNKNFHILGIYKGQTETNLIFQDTRAGVKALISKKAFVSAIPALGGGQYE